jgi:histone H3/H4
MAVAEEKQGAAHDSNNAVNSVSESTTPKTPTGGNSGGASAEFEPPLACVRRMLKNTLPSSTNVGKDASTAFSRACGIFVIYLTACANDYARESKRQTITAADILAAVKVSFMNECH